MDSLSNRETDMTIEQRRKLFNAHNPRWTDREWRETRKKLAQKEGLRYRELNWKIRRGARRAREGKAGMDWD